MAVENALTSMLYSGEQTDRTGMQYLRARYYDPANGRFNRVDPFAGNFDDPQSLHKYLYVHGDPVNGVDPSGLFYDLSGVTTGLYVGAKAASATLNTYGGIRGFLNGIEALYSGDRLGAALNFLQGSVNLGFAALDIFTPFTPPPAGGLGLAAAVGVGAGRLSGRQFGQLIIHSPGLASWIYGQLVPVLTRGAAGALGTYYANGFQEINPGTDKIRGQGGTASGGQNLPGASQGWLDSGMGLIPREVAAKLRGQSFRNWRNFRESFWRAVYSVPELRTQFNAGSQAQMAEGFAPFSPVSGQLGQRVKFELDHMEPLFIGGRRVLYDLDNIMVTTPKINASL